MPARIAIREIRRTTDPAIRAAYRLLRREFHADELVPRRDWTHTMRERERGLWTDLEWHLFVAERQQQVVGLATGSFLGNVNVGLIGYLAVVPAARAQRVGARLRRRLREAFERDARRLTGRPLEGMVGEVRSDNPWLAALIRREQVIVFDFPYYQPSIGGKKPVPLVLYYQPLARRRHSLPAAEVRRLLYTIWRRSYRVARPLTRPAFQAMMRALRARRTVPRGAARD